MEPKFSTLDLTPPVRPTGYRIAVVLLGLGLVGSVAAHLQAIGEMRREVTTEGDKARACEQAREALGAEIRTLRAAREAPAGSSIATTGNSAATTGVVVAKARGADAGASFGSGSPPSEEQVKSLIGTGQSKLQACYRRALRHDPDLGMRSLRLRLSFTVRSSGEVRGVAFSPSPARDLRSCLRDVVGRWKVKPFGGDSIAVEVPITLAPQS